MKKVFIESFDVNGMKIRTDNATEMASGFEKIGKLWGSFCATLPEPLEMYGVYFNYENDHNGEYDLIAGTQKLNAEEKVTIEKGIYLVFSSTKEEVHEAVSEAWMEVRHYFQANPKEQRAYHTDFEKYLAADGVEIYIGIR